MLTVRSPWLVRGCARHAIVFAVMLFFLAQDGNMETGNNSYQVNEGWSFYG